MLMQVASQDASTGAKVQDAGNWATQGVKATAHEAKRVSPVPLQAALGITWLQFMWNVSCPPAGT